MNPNHVLIIKMSSLGDVVQALPAATALRRRYPQARISWAVEGWIAPLLAGHPAIDRIVSFPVMRLPAEPSRWWRHFRSALRELRAEPCDVAVDLQGLFKSAVVSLWSGARKRVGVQRLREGAWLVSRAVPRGDERAHAVEEYLACAEALGAPGRPVSFRLPVADAAAASVDRLLSLVRLPAHEPLVIVNPSASSTRKTWPVERWAHLVEELAPLGRVVLIGTADQGTRHAAIGARARRKPYDLTGRTTLPELVALLDRSALHIAPDTGSAHIAAALGTPVIGIYGPMPPWRHAPWGQERLLAYHAGICGRTCPSLCLRRRRCLRAVRVEEVVRLAREVLASALPARRAETSRPLN